ncbi:hypothetical protein GOODEAATRI_032988, partial [Goodea atripinnis]
VKSHITPNLDFCLPLSGYPIICLCNTILHLSPDQTPFPWIGLASFVDFLCTEPVLARIALSRDPPPHCNAIPNGMNTPLGFTIAPVGLNHQHTGTELP